MKARSFFIPFLLLCVALLSVWGAVRSCQSKPNYHNQAEKEVNEALSDKKTKIDTAVDAMSDDAVNANYERKRAENGHK